MSCTYKEIILHAILECFEFKLLIGMEAQST